MSYFLLQAQPSHLKIFNNLFSSSKMINIWNFKKINTKKIISVTSQPPSWKCWLYPFRLLSMPKHTRFIQFIFFWKNRIILRDCFVTLHFYSLIYYELPPSCLYKNSPGYPRKGQWATRWGVRTLGSGRWGVNPQVGYFLPCDLQEVLWLF